MISAVAIGKICFFQKLVAYGVNKLQPCATFKRNGIDPIPPLFLLNILISLLIFAIALLYKFQRASDLSFQIFTETKYTFLKLGDAIQPRKGGLLI